MKPKPQITPAEAAELEAATLRNIVQKVASGGVPSQREADMIRKATAAEPAPKTNLRNATNGELARHYMVSLSTIKSWLKRHGSATVRDGAKLQAALDGQRSGKDIEPGTPLGKARLAKLEAETIRIRHLHAVEVGEYTANSEVGRIASAWGAQLQSELVGLVAECPAWAGLSPIEIQDRCRKSIYAVIGRLKTFSADAPKRKVQHEKA